MEIRELGLREARKYLGTLANYAHIAGDIAYLTRNGERIAAIVPIDRIKETAVQNTQRLAEQVTRSLDGLEADFDIDAIVEEIGETHGFDVDIDAISESEYWTIVGKHDGTLAATDQDIRDLMQEAGAAGDTEMAAICERALGGDETARAECAKAIANAQATADERA